MNRKDIRNGFTFIEILGVITLLALISTIVIVTVDKNLKDSKETLYKAQLESIRGSASMWMADNIERIPNDGYYTIILKKLVDNGYLEGIPENPKTGESFDLNTVIRISKNDILIGDEQLLSVVDDGDGLYLSKIDEDRFIYRGKEPNNYLILPENGTDTLYRIISYETDGTIKVIREERIGNTGIPWDSNSIVTKAPWRNTNFEESNKIQTRNNSNNTYCQYGENYYGCNVWGNQNNTYYEGQTLNDLYNSFHYKWYSSDDTTTLNPTSPDFTKTVNEDATLNTLLNREWLSEVGLEQYIDNHEFDVGGVYPNSKNLLTEKKEQALYKWIGKVGLMYITDMVESSTNPNCENVYTGKTSESPCKNTVVDTKYGNWMHKKNYLDLSLSAYSNHRNNVWAVESMGNFNNYSADYTNFSVRPVFFLKSSIQLIGNGTTDNPYRIK